MPVENHFSGVWELKEAASIRKGFDTNSLQGKEQLKIRTKKSPTTLCNWGLYYAAISRP
jgi:hypothetical protein